jgi:TolB-like protein
MASNDGENRCAEQDRGKIRDQLDRILNSPEFQAPDRGRRFLQYVVQEALEGRSDQLNAYTIAQAVFGRGVEFDAQSDPVVRIEAGRIRRALERYYLVSGSNDPVRITIPKGHYAPGFEQLEPCPEVLVSSNATTKTQQGARQGESRLTYRDLLVPVGVPAVFAVLAMLALIRPLEHYFVPSPIAPLRSDLAQNAKIIVEPFAMLGETSGGAAIARGLTDQLVSQLTKVGGIIVLDPVVSATTQPSRSTFSLQGTITSEQGSLHVQVRLIRSTDGSVVWAKRFDHRTEGTRVLDIQDEIGTKIVRDISMIGEIGGGPDSR